MLYKEMLFGRILSLDSVMKILFKKRHNSILQSNDRIVREMIIYWKSLIRINNNF